MPLGVGLLVALPPGDSVTTKNGERALMVSECLWPGELKGGTTLGFFYRNQTIPCHGQGAYGHVFFGHICSLDCMIEINTSVFFHAPPNPVIFSSST